METGVGVGPAAVADAASDAALEDPSRLTDRVAAADVPAAKL